MTRDTEDRHPGTQHALGMLTPNTRLDGIALDISVRIYDTVWDLVRTLEDGPELTAGLRKILEAKDCLVRQAIIDTGKLGPKP